MQNEAIRVLVVNGSATRDDQLSAILTTAGFETRMVSDAVSARGSLEIWRPLVVVADLRAPAGEAHRFTADLAERRDVDVPVVFVGEGSNLLKPNPIVPVGLVPTPIDEAHLVATVQRVVRTAEAARDGSGVAR